MKTRVIAQSIALLFISIVCFYPWQELQTAGGLGFISNNIGWTLISATILCSFWSFCNQEKIAVPKFWVGGLIGIGIACLPFLIASHEFISNQTWIPLGLLMSWFFLLSVINSQLFKQHKNLFLLLIVLACFVQVLIGLWQVFHSYMMEETSGFVEHELPQVKGTFNQRNLFASFITTGLVIALYVYPAKKNLKLKNLTLSVQSLNKLLLIYIFSASFTLILTDSRVGVYGYISCLMLLGVSYRKFWRKKLVISFSLIVIAFMLAQIFISALYENNTKDFTKVTSRQVIYHTSIEAIKDAPLFGHGLGSFEKVYLEKLSVMAKAGNLKYENLAGREANITHPHNEFFYWAIQGGLISTLGLLIILISILLLFRHTNLNTRLSYLALLFPIAFHLMVEFPFYLSTVHLIVYTLLISYVITSIGNYKSFSLKVRHKLITQTTIGIIVSGLILALILNTYSLFKAGKFERDLNPSLKDLDKILLTLGWKDTYQSLRLRHEANKAAKRGMLEPQVEYLNWLEGQIKLTPMLNYYFNLYAVNKHLGNDERAIYYYGEIERLFIGVEDAEEWLKINRDIEM